MSSYAFLVTCRRCEGRGRVSRYEHVDAGQCFGCHGHGVYRLLSQDILQLGWQRAPRWCCIDFVRSALGLLAAAGQEGAPTAETWHQATCQAIAEVLPSLSREQVGQVFEALREIDERAIETLVTARQRKGA